MQAVPAKQNTFDYDGKHHTELDIDKLRQNLEEKYSAEILSKNRDEMVEFIKQDETGASEAPLEHESETEIEKNIFHGISEFIKPVTNIWNKQPLMAPVISGIGAILHLVDGFAEMKGLADSTLKLTRGASIGYSKFITSMPNILDGIHRLKNNDYVEGLSRLFLLSKMKFGEPANFSMTNGAFTAFKTLKMFSKLENPEKFKSLGDNLKFLGKMFSNVLKEAKISLKEGGLVNTLDAVFRVISTPMMLLSGVLGTFTLGDEVDTPSARFFGALRNGFGIAADMSINIQAGREAQKKAAAENRQVNPIKDILSSEEGLVGSTYSILSLGELFQRYLPENISKITAQLLCGIQEIATSAWGVYDSLKLKVMSEEEMMLQAA